MSDELTIVCERARRYARQHPITAATMNVGRYRPNVFSPYIFRVSENYSVQITYNMTRLHECPFPPPFWHAQIIVMEQVSTLEFGAGVFAMVATKDWLPSQMSDATEILGEAFAPLIKTPSQDVRVHDGLWCRHFFTPATGSDETPN